MAEPGPPARDALLAMVRAYAPADPHEAAMRERLLAFVTAHDDALERTQVRGHVTVSAWIVDPSRTRTLLTHHRKLGKWVSSAATWTATMTCARRRCARRTKNRGSRRCGSSS